jgi:hypothetical protein
MSSLEVIGLVASIVSTFTATAFLIQERKKMKAEKRKAKLEDMRALEISATLGSPAVQREYDRNFVRLGKKFAKGDGKYSTSFDLCILS